MKPRRLHSETITSIDVIDSPRFQRRRARLSNSLARLVYDCGSQESRIHWLASSTTAARKRLEFIGSPRLRLRLARPSPFSGCGLESAQLAEEAAAARGLPDQS